MIAVHNARRHFRIVKTATGEVVHTVALHNDSDHYAEVVMSGLLRNMGDDYHVEDSKDDKR